MMGAAVLGSIAQPAMWTLSPVAWATTSTEPNDVVLSGVSDWVPSSTLSAWMPLALMAYTATLCADEDKPVTVAL